MIKAGTEEPQTLTFDGKRLEEISKQELGEILEQHREWIASRGKSGIRADLSHANLEGMDLAGADLRGASLRKARLAKADLSTANLEAALLTNADLREANLLGTKLRGARLQGANLEGAAGLFFEQFGGTNLFGAVLPKRVSEFEGLKAVGQALKTARAVFAGMLLASLLASIIAITTRDIQLVQDSPTLPIPHVGEMIPTIGFYLLAPLVLFGLYVYFHLCLQRTWEGLAGLPAIFPDGRALDKSGPWLLMSLARNHFKWLAEDRLPPSFLEAAIPKLLAYWLVPAALVVFWARYLALQDLHGSMLHISLVVLAVAFANFLPTLAEKTLRVDIPRAPYPEKSHWGLRFNWDGAITLGICALLSGLSLGTIYGVPHDIRRAPELPANDFRRWAANALWMVGYNPYVEISELEISSRPANWTAQDADLALVKGARLDRLSLRYAEAYRAFLVNASLWEADLQSADLSEADLSGANLRQANVQSTFLDHARIIRANLRKANLQKADLASADLREADLAYAKLDGTILVDAKLTSTSLYAAELNAARLTRADLEKADLREAHLEGAQMEFADLRAAYLWSAKLSRARLPEAQLQDTTLIQADLQGANLHGADLHGALLREADLSDANLQGADFRGAKGLTAGQICSATDRRGIQLDDDLQREVNSQCGAVR